MSSTLALDPMIELLDRALGYTRGVLAALDAESPPLHRRTPCADWDLGQLLAHMEDSLDAFGEGARGTVAVDPTTPVVARTAALRHKACALLGAWATARSMMVRVGDQLVPTSVVAGAASLEIPVHGWDAARAIDLDAPLPETLAQSLLPVASRLITPDDRGTRFSPALPVPAEADLERRLLAFVGREA